MPRRRSSAAMGLPTKKPSKTKTKPKRRAPKVGGYHPLVKVIHNRIEPFSRNNGSVIYDENTVPVLPIHAKRTVSMTSDANGFGAMIVTPSWANNLYYGPTIGAGGDMTAIGTATAGVNYSSTDYFKYRLVSCGIRVRTICAPTAAAGIIKVLVNGSPVATGGFDLQTTQSHAYSYSDAVFESDLTVHLKPTGPSSKEFQPIATTFAAFPGWTNATVVLIGAPASTSMLNIEVVHNYEAIAPVEGALHHHSQRPAPHIRGIEDLVDHARNLHPHVVDNTKPSKTASVTGGIHKIGADLEVAAVDAVKSAAPGVAAWLWDKAKSMFWGAAEATEAGVESGLLI